MVINISVLPDTTEHAQQQDPEKVQVSASKATSGSSYVSKIKCQL